MTTQTTKPAAPEPAPVEAAQQAAAQQIAPKRVRRWRARVFQGYLLTATIAFTILVVLASLFPYFAIDLSITRGLQTINSVFFTNLMEAISLPGYPPQSIILIAIIALGLYVLG